MKIQRIKIHKLHGFLNKDITFNDQINILVGINGSGKTSILNAITWMLTPSIPNLCVLNFHSIELYFNNKGTDYLMTCKKDDNKLSINLCNLDGSINYNEISAPIGRHLNSSKKDLLNYYSDLRPDKEERDLFNFIQKGLSTPTNLGIDRSMDFEANSPSFNHTFFDKDNSFSSREQTTSMLSKAEGLSNLAYSKYQNDIIKLNNKLKDDFIISFFDVEKNHDKKKTVNLKTLVTLESKFLAYISNRTHLKESISKPINSYFSNLKELMNDATTKKEKNKEQIFAQFEKIIKLLNILEENDKDANSAYKDIKDYLEILNSFFIDSYKQITFKEETSGIGYSMYDKNSIAISKNNLLSNLSSGEQQIIIMLTLVSFEKNRKIFIIDEPELSLHPKWQESFIEAIQRLLPSDSQIFLATHSPALVAGHEKLCKVLYPYNK